MNAAPAPSSAELVTRAKKAAVLQSAARAVENHRSGSDPVRALPHVALHHDLTLDQVKEIVRAHGWPRPDSMRRAAGILARPEARPEDDAQAEPRPEATATPALPPVDPDDVDDTYERVHVDQLIPDPNNVRDDLGDLTELARSIREKGILQAIVARRHDGQLIIVMGHRRAAAARLAGLRTVPVIIRNDLTDPDDVLAAMLIENGQRLNLDPIEEARAFARLKRADGASDGMVGERVSKSQAYVSGRLALLSLTPPQQAAVRAGSLSLERAIKLGRDQGGMTRPTAQGKKSAAHLDWHHPLAEKASMLCQANKHSKHVSGRPGGVACGLCWENTIRDDERTKVEARHRRAEV